ncbi:ethanolaminephosphotransferase 1 isoform X2 [Dermatophagoides farinae]|uniref:ethanolaminephosphotransferase 1 isoform X2 n=1 Tax=Dermatophagoides farinae TaxID=6954 RepID=UPI001F0FF821|nr:ethanolaminephosphotransferase 1-like isoform X2 [Dermatophagoides farinae]
MASLFNYKYLNHNHLKGFENYVYNSKDTSPLSKYVMHPFWNVVVKLVPMWIAPNVLTFVGFLMTAGNGLLLSIYDPEFYASSDSYPQFPPIPDWVWIVCAIFHSVAHTLDGIDGKHARRTKSSGPLGELMDHGMDSWTAFFIPFCIYSIFGRADYSQSPFHMHFIFWTIYITFYLSHWEKYNTGILYLPWSYDASQMALFIMYLVTYCYGHQIWKFTVPILNLTSGEFFEVTSYVTSFLLSIPMAFYNVYTCQTPKQKTFYQSFRPLISLIGLFIVSTLWAKFSPMNIIEVEPRTFYFMVGTVFSNIACRLIVSQMSSTKCDLINWFLYPLTISTLCAIIGNIDHQQELRLLRINAIIYTILHLHYAICIVRQMCHHFGIYCFSLDRPEKIKSPEQENLV